ncbi:MAG: hypothetical protein VSS75_029270 [Candidatus Parabeggiatoa sp.]|nr:hypothetical protein [Candidatus Parabeggiatoa sp.]
MHRVSCIASLRSSTTDKGIERIDELASQTSQPIHSIPLSRALQTIIIASSRFPQNTSQSIRSIP